MTWGRDRLGWSFSEEYMPRINVNSDQWTQKTSVVVPTTGNMTCVDGIVTRNLAPLACLENGPVDRSLIGISKLVGREIGPEILEISASEISKKIVSLAFHLFPC